LFAPRKVRNLASRHAVRTIYLSKYSHSFAARLEGMEIVERLPVELDFGPAVGNLVGSLFVPCEPSIGWAPVIFGQFRAHHFK
jgi:hypothetical protein